ncbi:hypothetical protein CYLTODRAFT_160914 [Cylindrobasidium torrendii FP15055 ss-10]|uniref:Nuclear rim protein 1 n=1 Tax=Cylindrobasidium torrendii FP15055 ss-10 TaxID=1314674 RepID=A0A0D7BKB5_9AGAR|nr:hypothetical protein CYLTODRAFT_160914 [Cylindrobasidium torrendii FP15055 ss-10]
MDFRRRLAQANSANSRGNASSQTSSTTSPAPPPPVTPRNRPRRSVVISHSPATTPSISHTIPFDWDAVRTRQPAPFATPRRLGNGVNPQATPARRRAPVVRKRTCFEKLADFPSRLMFEASQFPNNVPLPEPKNAAWLLGGLCHLLHLVVRIKQCGSVSDDELGWESMHYEARGTSWFDWTFPMTLLLLATSVGNAIYLLTRVRVYRLNKRSEPVSSPNARFVSSDIDVDIQQQDTLVERVSAIVLGFVRRLCGSRSSTEGASTRRTSVQQIDMWNPGERPMHLFCIYSPAHCFLWMATGSTNWMIMLIVMSLVWAQLTIFVNMYTCLVKDKEIIAAEVMYEYNTGFVYPRVNPVRRDAATMTHESEMVDPWTP